MTQYYGKENLLWLTKLEKNLAKEHTVALHAAKALYLTILLTLYHHALVVLEFPLPKVKISSRTLRGSFLYANFTLEHANTFT